MGAAHSVLAHSITPILTSYWYSLCQTYEPWALLRPVHSVPVEFRLAVAQYSDLQRFCDVNDHTTWIRTRSSFQGFCRNGRWTWEKSGPLGPSMCFSLGIIVFNFVWRSICVYRSFTPFLWADLTFPVDFNTFFVQIPQCIPKGPVPKAIHKYLWSITGFSEKFISNIRTSTFVWSSFITRTGYIRCVAWPSLFFLWSSDQVRTLQKLPMFPHQTEKWWVSQL